MYHYTQHPSTKIQSRIPSRFNLYHPTVIDLFYRKIELKTWSKFYWLLVGKLDGFTVQDFPLLLAFACRAKNYNNNKIAAQKECKPWNTSAFQLLPKCVGILQREFLAVWLTFWAGGGIKVFFAPAFCRQIFWRNTTFLKYAAKHHGECKGGLNHKKDMVKIGDAHRQVVTTISKFEEDGVEIIYL